MEGAARGGGHPPSFPPLASQPLGSSSCSQEPGQEERATVLWRPWLPGPWEPTVGLKEPRHPACDRSPGKELAAPLLMSFRHPVRFCWPKSRSFDYLYAEGEELLRNFPMQAAIGIYEDSDGGSSCDSTEEEEEEGCTQGMFASHTWQEHFMDSQMAHPA